MLARALALAALFTIPCAASAQYPENPPTIVVPFAFGTPADLAVRIAAAALQQSLGRTVQVEDQPGKSAYAEVAAAPADGYTLLAIAMPMAADPSKDFTAVGQVTVADYVLVAHRSMAAHDVPQLVASLKSEAGRYRFGSAGNGTLTHLAGELFKRAAGVDAQHVPYKQLGVAVGDVAVGRLQFMFLPTAPALPHIKSGALRPLAVTGPRRLEVLKDTPTMIESGFRDFVVRDWVGLVVRKGTPEPIIERLNGALARGLADPDYRIQLGRMGAQVATGTPRAFDELIAAEIARWQPFTQKR